MRILPPISADLSKWAENIRHFLSRALDQLGIKDGDSSASEDGIFLWDRVAGYPVVSKGGEWRQVVLEDGNASGAITADQVAGSANTAYALTYTLSVSEGIISGTPATRLVFEEAGEYMVSFSAQIASTISSTVNFWFWPRINGSDVAGASMKNALHQNGSVLVVSRSAIFNLAADDYLEVMWAVDSTNGTLHSTAATAFAPAAPSSTIAITRLHG